MTANRTESTDPNGSFIRSSHRTARPSTGGIDRSDLGPQIGAPAREPLLDCLPPTSYRPRGTTLRGSNTYPPPRSAPSTLHWFFLLLSRPLTCVLLTLPFFQGFISHPRNYRISAYHEQIKSHSYRSLIVPELTQQWLYHIHRDPGPLSQLSTQRSDK